MRRLQEAASESSPSLRTFANIRIRTPAKAGVQLRVRLGSCLRRSTAVKQINVWPAIIMLILVLFLVYWLRPH